MALTANVLAADIHKRMVDDNRFGYSWEERYGARMEEWTVDGQPIRISVGDYDCSSSTITAWRLALKAFGVKDPLPGATYTGNIRGVFLRSGLFQWRTDFSNATRGDLVLNEANHVAMVQGGGKLSEFCWGDNGAYGNRRGDQSGIEARTSNWYSYPWDGYLHYVGKLEIGDDDDMPTPKDLWDYRDNSVFPTNATNQQRVNSIDKKTQQILDRQQISPWLYKNKDVNGNKDAYQLLTESSRGTQELEKRVSAIEKKLDQIIKALG